MNYNEEVQNRTLPTAKKNGEYWTQREIDSLFSLFDEGMKLEDIALKLERSYYAVSSMHGLGHRTASEWVEKSRGKGNRVVTRFDGAFTDIEALFNDYED